VFGKIKSEKRIKDNPDKYRALQRLWACDMHYNANAIVKMHTAYSHLEHRKLPKWRKSFVVARIFLPGVIHSPRRKNHHRQLAACFKVPVEDSGLRRRHGEQKYGASVDTIFSPWWIDE